MPTTLEPQERRPQERTSAPDGLNSEPPHRRSFWWVWVLVLAAAGFGGYRWYQASQAQQTAAAGKQKKTTDRPVPVVASLVRTGDIPVYLRGLGSVTAYNTVTVKTRVDGQLTEVAFKEGQFVNKDDLLAQIDPRPYQVQLEQAEGQLARDQAQLKDAQVNLDRYQTLWQEQVIAKQQLDTQGATVGQSQGTIVADKSAIDNAKLQLTYARITAPISGVIGLRLVDAGNIVHATDSTGLAVITQLQPISVLFTIPADNLPPVLRKLENGGHPEVGAYDRDDKIKLATGTLLTVDNQIDMTTGTSRLKATFSNQDHALFPNQFVNCRLLLDMMHNATILPVAAVQHGPQGTFVFVIEDGKAEIRPVTMGLTEGNDATVKSGVKPGDMVVTDGQDKLQDGSLVTTRATTRTTGGRTQKNP